MRKRKIEGERGRRKGKGEEDGKDGMIQKGGLNKFISPVNDRILPSFLSVKYLCLMCCEGKFLPVCCGQYAVRALAHSSTGGYCPHH